MRLHCIIHASFEQPGIITSWANQKGYELTETHTYRGEQLPSLEMFDMLVVMGGPQSPLGITEWPYLQDEMQLIRKAMVSQKAILGICLGAQLIAQSLGAQTERSPNKEIGFFPIELLPDAADDPVFSQFPKEFSVIHWHNDMPGIPEHAKLLAKSAGCPRQAFSIGDRIYGLQCHMEMTKQNIEEMVQHCSHDLIPERYVESKQQLLNHDLHIMNNHMVTLLDYLSLTID